MPKDWFPGLVENWKSDLIAAFSVALVALPLGLGVAIASGVPPVAGLLAAAIGGVVTTLIRGSQIPINGPAASLIIIIFTAMQALGEFKYVLAAFIFAGIIQIGFGLFKLGKLGDAFPASVIQGMLAAIGVIIFGKQIHVALGYKATSSSAFDNILEIPRAIIGMNPMVACIGILGILILVFHPKIKNKLVHFLPAPVWVLAISIPLVYLFNFFETHNVTILSQVYEVGPHHLIKIPSSLMEGIIFPDFSKIARVEFWVAVISITLVATMETVLASKALEKLDPWKRSINIDHDLIAIGFTTLICGCLGGLPIITVIVRSSVNINNGGRTRWANFYHGLLVLLSIVLFSPLINQIPLAALAAILVFTGYKLASPHAIMESYQKGIEQIFILLGTVIVTLISNLIVGVGTGILIALIVHLVKSSMPISVYFKYIFKPAIQVTDEGNDSYLVKVQGIANFTNIMNLSKNLNAIPPEKDISVDFSHANLVDLTVMEYLEEFGERYQKSGGTFCEIGLDLHQSASDHPHAIRVHVPPNKIYRLTRRQEALKSLCENHDWQFEPQIKWDDFATETPFQFFEKRPIEYRNNVIKGHYQDSNVDWEIFDVTFDEGALLAAQVYHATVQIVNLPRNIPEFVLEREEFFDKLLEFTGFQDIDYQLFTSFSKKFVIKGADKSELEDFFNQRLIHFFEHEDIYHMESNGNSIFIFKYVRLASPNNIEKMVDFSHRFIKKLNSFTGHLA